MTPRVFVQVWCEMDPSLNLRVDRQTGVPLVEGGDVLMRVSPSGRHAVDAALKIANAEVIAFAVGDGHEEALRHALAAGAPRAVQISGSDENIAALTAWLAGQKPDLVIADRMAGRIAASLGWAHLAGVDQLQTMDGRLRAIRHLGRGDSESVTAALPAAVCMQTESGRARYISQIRIAGVQELPIERVTLDVSASARKNAEVGPLQQARPRTRLGSASPAAAPAKAVDRLNALLGVGTAPAAPASKAAATTAKTSGQMAEEFVRYLRHNNLFN